MKIISAPAQDFNVYITRPETVFIEREEESLESLYAQGYLPYSGAKDLHNIFYNARSARIEVSSFTLTSENRRIAKKFDGMFKKERAPFTEFSLNEAFYNFCVSYFSERHGPKVMPLERLKTILYSGLISSITTYRSSSSRPVGYVLEVENGKMSHYWYSFYDLACARQSLGLWLMLDMLRDAKLRGLEQYYLGTVYGEKALYKTNFMPLAWWDGSRWNEDIALLKQLSRKD